MRYERTKTNSLSSFQKLSFNILCVLLSQADIDNSGTIDYGEFLAATLHMNKMEREENLVAAFSYFDKDGSGYITIDELQSACTEFGLCDTPLDDMIKEIDLDNVKPLFFFFSLFTSFKMLPYYNRELLNCVGREDRFLGVYSYDEERRWSWEKQNHDEELELQHC